MNPLRSLRARLVGALLLILCLALGISTALDVWAGAAPAAAEYEPYQDALVLAGFSVPALLLIWLVSLWSLRPLVRVSQEARRVGPQEPSARLSQTGLPAEIVPLVQAVNGALDRMADAFAAERRFTENAAHELRTPLAVLSLRLQRAKQSSVGPATLDWPAIDRDLAQMNRLVSQLLDLARKENAGRAHDGAAGETVNLSRLAREACAMVLPMAEQQCRALTIAIPDMLPVRGHGDDLRDALRNLLENAVTHGAGTIAVTGQAAAGSATLSVSDEGPGIPHGEEQAVFERFHKDGRSTGTGLGLAIVREVVRAHGGQVTIRPGPGCKVDIALPAAPS